MGFDMHIAPAPVPRLFAVLTAFRFAVVAQIKVPAGEPLEWDGPANLRLVEILPGKTAEQVADEYREAIEDGPRDMPEGY